MNVIKEIFERCRPIEGRSITLLPPKDNDELANTVQIYIRTNDETLKSCIEKIAEERNLATRQDENYFIIYKPHSPTK